MDEHGPKRSVIVMPETAGDFLCLMFTGVVTPEAHYNGLITPMRGLIDKYGHYCLLLYFHPDFQGYTPEAASQSFNSINEMGPLARRIGYVNPSERKIFQTKLMAQKLAPDSRFFNSDELATAIKWVRDGV